MKSVSRKNETKQKVIKGLHYYKEMLGLCRQIS